MRLFRHFLVLVLVLFLGAAASAEREAASPASLPTPSQFLGFEVGGDRHLADYRQIVSYFKMLAANSRRVEVESLGPTTMGNDLVMAVISSEENLKNRKKYQEIARRLADPRGLKPEQVEELVRQGKVIVLVTCNIHSTEIGATQMAMEWAHDLAAAQDEETRRRLDRIILLLVPSLNPDGQIMETEWYRKNLGTRYEGGRMPWLYHPYVGHDNNRDWYMLTQKETQAVTRMVYREWLPQVWLDEHQMGSSGPRIFLPPYAEPAASTIPPLMWRGVNQIGATMAWRLEQQRKSGVIYDYAFDAYWPGSTDGTAWWKNIFGLLTELASVRLATPVDIPATELAGGRKGLIDYGTQTNYPNPWPGGRWRLRDIMDYERTASDALLETCATHREDFLRGTATMAQDAVQAAKPDEYYRIAWAQRDPVTAARLAHLLREHGVEVLVAADPPAFLVPTAQPYGRFLAEMLGRQRYPKVKAVAGQDIIPPYDVTTWSLPLLMGVEVEKVTLPAEQRKTLRPIAESDWPQGGLDGAGEVFAVSHQANNVTRLVNAVLKEGGSVSVARETFSSKGFSYPAGTVIIEKTKNLETLAARYQLKLRALAAKPNVPASRLHAVRVGLYKPWLASIDEGWTRWLLEQYEFDLKSLDNKTIQGGNLNASFDAIILPDVTKEVIVEGKPKREEGEMKYFEELPPEYAGGIGKEGIKSLKDFVEKGGTIIALASSGELLVDEFNIPVRNTLAKSKASDFLCPGSLLRVQLDRTHPVNYGMEGEVAAFVDDAIAYQTVLPGGGLQRSVLAWYPNEAEDILLSGWVRGPEKLQRRAAAVALRSGKGKLVLFGFRVQHRAQAEGTFKMLFNAIQWASMEE